MNQLASTLPVPQHVSQADRFSLTTFLALAFHAIIILGVSFNLTNPSNDDLLSTMEITLVSNHSEDEPDEADYLAQENQLGGGNVRERVRDSSPFSNDKPSNETGFAPNSERMFVPPQSDTENQLEVLAADRAREKIDNTPMKDPLPTPTEKVTAAQLYERSQEIARLSAEIDELKKAFQVSPKHTYVRGANAKKYRFAAYMDAWRRKIEETGNINYPQEAIERNLTGSLLLDVAILPSGKVDSIRILKSSGEKVLDDAAKNIVKLASPFPPLTKDILKDTDILHIPRVWHFKSGRGLTTQFAN